MVSKVNYRPEYLVSNNGSITIQYLSSGYTNIQTAGGGGVPASPDTSVQFNNSGAFGGSANFIYVPGTNTITFGPVSATATLKATDTSVASTFGGQLTLRSGDGLFTGTNGGTTIVRGGNGTTVGGSGGNTQLNGGNGYTNGGNLELAAGFANAGTETGAIFTAYGGERNVSGGALDFSAGGGGVGSGGSVSFSSGGSGSAAGGSINFVLQGGATDDGEITFKNPNGETYAYFKNDVPGGVQQIGFFNATPVFKPAPTASGTQAVVDSLVSSLNSLGLVDSAALTNATVITPAGANTQIQYNNANAFGASPNFTYDATNRILNVGPAGATTIIETLAPTGSTVAGTLTVRGKNASATNGNGGPINLTTGNGVGTGVGGVLTLRTGTSSAGNGGQLAMRTGSGVGTGASGGDLDIQLGGGVGASGGYGGSFFVNSGFASPDFGGTFYILGGGGGIGGTFAMGCGGSTTGSGGDLTFSMAGGPVDDGNLYVQDGYGRNFMQCRTASGGGGAQQIGFFEATPVIKPTITGSRSTQTVTVLANLLTALANLGLITNSTTA
jgi:hypothetical protein